MIPKDKPEYKTAAGMPLWAMDVYYKFLDCGFRLPVSAGSATGVKAAPLGYGRVYVKTERRINYHNWFRSLKAGRSFATNGPMLFLTVDGQGPGAVLPGHRDMHIHAEASSQYPLDRLEVVYKGNIVRTVRGPGKLIADFTAAGSIPPGLRREHSRRRIVPYGLHTRAAYMSRFPAARVWLQKMPGSSSIGSIGRSGSMKLFQPFENLRIVRRCSSCSAPLVEYTKLKSGCGKQAFTGQPTSDSFGRRFDHTFSATPNEEFCTRTFARPAASSPQSELRRVFLAERATKAGQSRRSVSRILASPFLRSQNGVLVYDPVRRPGSDRGR